MEKKATPPSGYPELKSLGVSAAKNKGLYKFNKPNQLLLETFSIPPSKLRGYYHDGNNKNNLEITINANEFTCCCPITGQPDYGKIKVVYAPHGLCLESKSLKLYLMGYRNYGSFHETVVTMIGDHLIEVLKPRYLFVTGIFDARGGISFHPTYEWHSRR